MFNYDQPIEQAKPEPRPAAAPASFSVVDLVQLLCQRKVAIVSAALLCACIAVVIGKSLNPKYTATAQLYVDPRELQLVDRELTPRAQDVSGLAMVVESQARLITSNNVLLQVIKDTHLDGIPNLAAAPPGGSLPRCLACSGSRASRHRSKSGRPGWARWTRSSATSM